MVKINKGFVEYKNHMIPLMEIESYINSNNDLLLEASVLDLYDIFVFGLPYNFKDFLLKKVRLYDASSEVNSFTYQGKEYWLDKTQRMSIMNLLNTISLNSNNEDVNLEIILGDDIYTLNYNEVLQLIANLEQYAYQCKVATQRHLNAIQAIEDPKTLEEYETFVNTLINYDFTVGYPDKLEL